MAPGVRQLVLPTSTRSTARLIRLAPGSRVPEHTHSGRELTLVVTGAAPSAQLYDSYATGRDASCTASKLALTSAGVPGNFSVAAGWPASISMQMWDDCGSPVTTGNAVASFSNGDPPLTLCSDLITGTYSGTWNVGNAQSQVTMRAI